MGKQLGLQEDASNVINAGASFTRRLLMEILAICFWIYVVTKLFVYDVDVALVHRFLPEYSWLLSFKLFIIIGVIAIIWLFISRTRALMCLSFVLLYPCIVLLWRLPRWIYRRQSWLLALSAVNAVIAFFTSLRYNFIVAATYVCVSVVILVCTKPHVLFSASGVLMGLLAITYVRRFCLVFRKSSMFRAYLTLFNGVRNHACSSMSLDPEIKSLPVTTLNQQQLDKWTSCLQTAVLLNRAYLFVARKLRDYQKSGINWITSLFITFLLIILTVITFALVNYGLIKADPSLFASSGSTSGFTFVYYSFNVFLFNSIAELSPVHPIAQAVSMFESFCALVMGVLFVSLIFSVRTQRHSQELEDITSKLEAQGTAMELFIRDEFQISTIDDAMSELRKLEASLIKAICKLSEHIR